MKAADLILLCRETENLIHWLLSEGATATRTNWSMKMAEKAFLDFWVISAEEDFIGENVFNHQQIDENSKW